MTRAFCIAALLLAATMPVHAQVVGDGKLSLGDVPPELQVKFLKKDPITLAEGVGKNVFIIEFWATWCGFCIESIPHLTALQRQYEEAGLKVIAISDETHDEIQEFLDKKGTTMDYSVAADVNGSTKLRYYDAFGLEGVPQAFIIDANGRVAWQGHPKSKFIDRLIPVLLEDIKPQDAPSEETTGPEPAGEE